MLSMIPAVMVACASVDQMQAEKSALESSATARALIGPAWPLNTLIRRTTAGDIYLDNVDSQIDALETRLSVIRSDIFVARLAMLYYHRFQVRGRLDDAEYARLLLSSAEGPNAQPGVSLAYARVLTGFHEFDAATAVLEGALERGADRTAVLELQQSIRRATGMDRELPLESNPPPSLLALRAADEFNLGHPGTASRLLKEAQDSYTDSSPYVLAWIHTQQGILFLREGDYASARLFFAAAHERFPQYTLAAEHLAETEFALGHLREARELYRTVSRQAGHPEYFHQLSRVERAMGFDEPAARNEDLAREGYERLMDRYPLMYADHAARYLVATGQESAALRLATDNSARRHDVASRTLLIDTQLHDGRIREACEGLRELRRQGFEPPEFKAIASQCVPRG